MALSVTIDRTSLSLSPLVITDFPTPDLPWWLPEDGVAEPAWAYRTTEAPESAFMPGAQPLAAVLDASSLPLNIYAQAVPTATLPTVKAILELAVSQFRYAITVTVDGDAKTYAAYPSFPQWGQVDSGMVAAKIARCSITIPINPVGA